jgi:hypothetical protein
VSRFRILGLDWFEVVVQVGLTIAIGTAIDSLIHGPGEDAMMAVLIGGSLFGLAVRRRRALARLPDAPADVERVEELESRVGGWRSWRSGWTSPSGCWASSVSPSGCPAASAVRASASREVAGPAPMGGACRGRLH